MRQAKSMKEWLAAISLAVVIAVIAAAALFLAGPMLLQSKHVYARHVEVSASGWSPLQGMDFRDVDSIGSSSANPMLCIRYDSEAPRRLGLSFTSVLPDGSEKRDTLEIDLQDMYGESSGRNGYGISEILYAFPWMVNVADCRLLEVAPIADVKGILSVGLLIDNDVKKETHRPSGSKVSRI